MIIEYIPLMEQPILVGREFGQVYELESFVNFNLIKRTQILTINNSSTYRGNGNHFRSVFLYFILEEPLKYDKYVFLPQKQKEIIKSKIIEVLQYGVGDHSDWAYWIKQCGKDPDDEESKKLILGRCFESKCLDEGIYKNKNFDLIFPTTNTLEYDAGFMPLLEKININLEDIAMGDRRFGDWELINQKL